MQVVVFVLMVVCWLLYVANDVMCGGVRVVWCGVVWLINGFISGFIIRYGLLMCHLIFML